MKPTSSLGLCDTHTYWSPEANRKTDFEVRSVLQKASAADWFASQWLNLDESTHSVAMTPEDRSFRGASHALGLAFQTLLLLLLWIQEEEGWLASIKAKISCHCCLDNEMRHQRKTVVPCFGECGGISFQQLQHEASLTQEEDKETALEKLKQFQLESQSPS